MPITINGTTGIAGVDGSAATPALQGTDTNTGVSFGIDTVNISTNGAQRVTVDSSGRVGIGTGSPVSTVNIRKDSLGTGGVAESAITLTYSSTNYGQHFIDSNGVYNIYANTNGVAGGQIQLRADAALIFNTASNERARLTASGQWLVGTSSTSEGSRAVFQGWSGDANGSAILKFALGAATPAADQYLAYFDFTDSGHLPGARFGAQRDGGTWSASSKPSRLVISTCPDGSATPVERLRIASSGRATFDPFGAGFYIMNWNTGAGTNAVKYNSSTGQLTWDSSSRLVKDDIEDCPYGIDAIKQLQSRIYTRKDGGEREIGFIADEVQAVIPELVPIGPKSAITGNADDTEEIPISVNYDKFVAVLTKALQEAIAKIETLEQRLADAGIA